MTTSKCPAAEQLALTATVDVESVDAGHIRDSSRPDIIGEDAVRNLSLARDNVDGDLQRFSPLCESFDDFIAAGTQMWDKSDRDEWLDTNARDRSTLATYELSPVHTAAYSRLRQQYTAKSQVQRFADVRDIHTVLRPDVLLLSDLRRQPPASYHLPRTQGDIVPPDQNHDKQTIVTHDVYDQSCLDYGAQSSVHCGFSDSEESMLVADQDSSYDPQLLFCEQHDSVLAGEERSGHAMILSRSRPLEPVKLKKVNGDSSARRQRKPPQRTSSKGPSQVKKLLTSKKLSSRIHS